MEGRAIAFANNDIAYVWWFFEGKIENCLGFSVHRIDASGTSTPLPAYVGFEPGEPGVKHKFQNTDIWPIQSYQWKDVFAKPGTYQYKVIPMLGEAPDAMKADVDNALTTEKVTISGDYGDIQAYFNVGLISTQAITRKVAELVENGKYKNATAALLGEIAVKDSVIRQRLAGDVLHKGLLALPKKAAEENEGSCKMALYELTDRELKDAILGLSASDKVRVCLSNADGSREWTGPDGKKHSEKILDKTNTESRHELHAKHVDLTDRFVPSSSIGHNKFVVYHEGGKPTQVLAGSTNWTATGLCSQTNNAILMRNDTLALGYAEYWDYLVHDAGESPVQGSGLRSWCGESAVEATVDEGMVRVWFSPNTVKRTKDEDVVPPDLAEVFELIRAAKKGVLFLAFNPGTPSCLEVVRERAEELREQGKPFFVRGAVTDPSPLGQFATFLTKRDALEAPDVLVTGVAGVPDQYSYWETELFKLGHAVIHDKILVIDPFSPDCVVVTGSHNLGFKASYQNDENLIIVKGHRRLAHAYAAHVLDVTNHFAWRSKLSYLHKLGKMEKAWGDLEETDTWQDKYFDDNELMARDTFFFME